MIPRIKAEHRVVTQRQFDCEGIRVEEAVVELETGRHNLVMAIAPLNMMWVTLGVGMLRNPLFQQDYQPFIETEANIREEVKAAFLRHHASLRKAYVKPARPELKIVGD